MHGGLPEYPHAAIAQRIEGEVVLDVTVDPKGEVSDARVLSGPDELRRASLESVLRWHYSPAELRSTSLQVALQFHLPAGPTADNYEVLYKPSDYKALAWEIEPEKPSDPKRVERQMIELENALKSPDITDSQRDELKHKSAALVRRRREGRDDPHDHRALIPAAYFFEILTPPLCVRTRMGGPPAPRSALIWRSIRPCTVTGKSILNPPFTVPDSRCAE
jgi:TonB family protein